MRKTVYSRTGAETNENVKRAESVLESVNAAAGAARGLFLGFMFLTGYIAVVLGITNDLQLLEYSPVMLPIFNIEINAKGFFYVMPILYLVIHVNLLLVCFYLVEKISYLNQCVKPLSGSKQSLILKKLHVTIWAQYLARRHQGLVFKFTGIITWCSIFVIPLLLLLWLQIVFLPAQEVVATWIQRGVIVIDAMITFILGIELLKLQRTNQSGFGEDRPNQLSLQDVLLVGAPLFFTVTFSMLYVTIPLSDWELFINNCTSNDTEVVKLIQYRRCIPLPTDYLFEREKSWFKRRPDLTGIVLTENKLNVNYKNILRERKYDKEFWSVINKKIVGIKLDNRNLKFAVLRNSILPKANLKFANLYGADLAGAQMYQADLTEAQLQYAQLPEARLQHARLVKTDLSQSSLRVAGLQDANLEKAQMQGAFLQGTFLNRARLGDAILGQAYLRGAHLQGAILRNAQLKGVNLTKAEMQGAYLGGVELQGANLSGTLLQGADLTGAQLQGADLSAAQLQGAVLSGAQMQGANLTATRLQGADLARTRIQGTVLSGTKIQAVDLTGAQLQGSYFSSAEVKGARFTDAAIDGVILETIQTNWTAEEMKRTMKNLKQIKNEILNKLAGKSKATNRFDERIDAAIRRIRRSENDEAIIGKPKTADRCFQFVPAVGKDDRLRSKTILVKLPCKNNYSEDPTFVLIWADYVANTLVCSILGSPKFDTRYPKVSKTASRDSLRSYLRRVIVKAEKEIRYSAVYFDLKRIIFEKKSDCEGIEILTDVWTKLETKDKSRKIGVKAAKVLNTTEFPELIERYSKEIDYYLK